MLLAWCSLAEDNSGMGEHVEAISDLHVQNYGVL